MVPPPLKFLIGVLADVLGLLILEGDVRMLLIILLELDFVEVDVLGVATELFFFAGVL